MNNGLKNTPSPRSTSPLRASEQVRHYEHAPRRGFSLVELFIVISIMGILTALIIPQFSPGAAERLTATAHIVAADIDYARNLAVNNNSSYRLTFDPAANLYYLEHSGADTTLNNLPTAPVDDDDTLATRQTTRLDALPHVGPATRLLGAAKVPAAGSLERVTVLEFGPLGETTRAEPTRIYLAAGVGSESRYLPLDVDPVTGLVAIGEMGAVQPTIAEAGGAGGTP